MEPTAMPYLVFDADNHYYEAPDAFTRHMPKKMMARCMQWAEIDGRTRLLVAGKISTFIPNALFDPIAKPGCMYEYFKGENPEGLDMRTAFGELEPIRPEYRDRDARLGVMTEQGVERTLLFPTLGVGMEQSLTHDPEACHAAFHAFNEWLDDDWGFAYQDRIFAVPYLTLTDPDRAVAEVEWAIDRGARLINVRSNPVETVMGSKSHADPMFDPVWARLEEAGILVTTHIGANSRIFGDRWEGPQQVGGFKPQPLRWIVSVNRDITDFCAAIISHGLFTRFPRLRLMSVENGAAWVGPLKKLLKKAHAQNPGYFAENPIEIFDRHVWVTPFWEDAIDEVLDTVAHDRITFGSDWPHAEGNVRPLDYADTVMGLDAELQRMILRDNVSAAVGT